MRRPLLLALVALVPMLALADGPPAIAKVSPVDAEKGAQLGDDQYAVVTYELAERTQGQPALQTVHFGPKARISPKLSVGAGTATLRIFSGVIFTTAAGGTDGGGTPKPPVAECTPRNVSAHPADCMVLSGPVRIDSINGTGSLELLKGSFQGGTCEQRHAGSTAIGTVDAKSRFPIYLERGQALMTTGPHDTNTLSISYCEPK